jgi:trimethylamine--corrinoid protein Co-methyltransferase
LFRTPDIAAADRADGPATAPGAGTAAIHQMPWTIPQNQDAPVEPLRPEQIEGIHNGAMRILEEIGILFLNEDALKILKQAGCDVDFATQRVRMDRAFVMEQVAKRRAPSTSRPKSEPQGQRRRRRDAVRERLQSAQRHGPRSRPPPR